MARARSVHDCRDFNSPWLVVLRPVRRMIRRDLEALYVENLPRIDMIVALLARRHGLSPDAADKFAIWAKARILENDFAVLAKFRGRSSLATYLAVVLTILCREYRVRHGG
jgi:hypothetical protein